MYFLDYLNNVEDCSSFFFGLMRLRNEVSIAELSLSDSEGVEAAKRSEHSRIIAK